jgi:hypothetical protein
MESDEYAERREKKTELKKRKKSKGRKQCPKVEATNYQTARSLGVSYGQ